MLTNNGPWERNSGWKTRWRPPYALEKQAPQTDVYLRKNVNESRFLYLPIHRKALKSLTWDICSLWIFHWKVCLTGGILSSKSNMSGFLPYLFRKVPRSYWKANSQATAAAKLLQSCPTLCDPIDGSLLGAGVRNPAHGKGHEEGSQTKCKGVIWLQGFPLSFPEHLPPKTRVGLILLYCAFPLFWHSLEKVNSGLQSSAFERSVSAQTPRMAL